MEQIERLAHYTGLAEEAQQKLAPYAEALKRHDWEYEHADDQSRVARRARAAQPADGHARAARPERRAYQKVLADTLHISPARAVLVEAYLRLQYSTLWHLSRADFRHEYTRGGISEAIDADPESARALAASYGLVGAA